MNAKTQDSAQAQPECLPQAGGSYVRQTDGSLQAANPKTPAPAAAPQTDTPE